MNYPAFFATAGYGDTQWSQMHYSHVVRVGNRVETSGQCGWTDRFAFPQALKAEITQAFDNLERTLATLPTGAGSRCSRLRRRSSPAGSRPSRAC